MSMEISVVVAGGDEAILEEIGTILRANPVFSVSIRALQSRKADLLDGSDAPDLLILQVGSNWERELQQVVAVSSNRRPLLLVIGQDHNALAMRLAMQAGARDFFFTPLPKDEFQSALQRIVNEKLFGNEFSQGSLLAVINAKGGSGASLFASNIAHVLTVRGAQQVALVDVDLQFGALPQYFDLKVHDGLLHALDALESLDAVALDGFMVRHRSGLHLMGSAHERLLQPGAIEIPQADKRLGRLLALMRKRYNQIVVDLPRQIDRFTSVVLQGADRVMIVVQQSLAHIRDGQLLLTYLHELAVQPERILIVINRYDKRLPVTLENIESAFQQKCLTVVSNDFRTVSESVNLGIPLHDFNSKAQITREIAELAEQLSVRPFPKEKVGLIGRLLGRGGAQ